MSKKKTREDKNLNSQTDFAIDDTRHALCKCEKYLVRTYKGDPFAAHATVPYALIIGASLSEPHCYVANRGKRNALWCVRTRNFSTLIKIPSACDWNFYQFVVNLPIVFPSSQLWRQFAWLCISQDASHFARRNLLAELVEQ